MANEDENIKEEEVIEEKHPSHPKVLMWGSLAARTAKYHPLGDRALCITNQILLKATS